MTATELPPAPATPVSAPPLPAGNRTRRRLLVALSVVFALWVVALVVMYFGTVYPQRHPKGGRPADVVPPARSAQSDRRAANAGP